MAAAVYEEVTCKVWVGRQNVKLILHPLERAIDEWALEVDAEDQCSAVFRRFHVVADAGDNSSSQVQTLRYGCRQKTSNSVGGEAACHDFEGFPRGVHDVGAGNAVHVEVDQA